jgi:pyruvate dehydrogenase E1 component alpha subunit
MSDTDLIMVLDPDGNADEDAIKDIPVEKIKEMYRLMVFTRLWNAKALSLQRQGRMGTLASVKGQEASNIGMGMALKPEDWFCPSFREAGAQLARGLEPASLYTYWAGDETGAKLDAESHNLPTCITVGSHLLHAAGIAWAAKMRGDKIAVLSSSGDGSTSQGDFHESLNFAGVFKLPVVFAIQNNHWAISVPVEKQTATETLSEKACAYGIDGVRVDGNDVLAVYLTIQRLLDEARSDYKPSLVELVTYRMDDHTTSDDATRYRTEEMLEPWKAKDPIDRVRKFLMAKHGWDEEQDTELNEECSKEVEKTVSEFESAMHPEPTDMFEHTYAELPWHLREQKEELLQNLGESESAR